MVKIIKIVIIIDYNINYSTNCRNFNHKVMIIDMVNITIIIVANMEINSFIETIINHINFVNFVIIKIDIVRLIIDNK